MTFSEKKNIILNALIERKGLQYLTDTIAETLKNPFFIYDTSGKILARSQNKKSHEVWEKINPTGHLYLDNIKMVEQAGILERIMSNDEPVYGKFPFSPYAFLECRIRDKDDTVGVAVVVELEPLLEEDGELLMIACKAILFEMLYREWTGMQTVPYFSLFKNIIENVVSETEIRARSQMLRLRFPKAMRLLGIKFSDFKKNNLSLYFLRETLLSSIPPCFCIIYDERLLLILSEQYVNKTVLNMIRRVFSDDDTHIGISRIFTNILALRDAFGEIKAIQNVYHKLNLELPWTYYEDIQVYHFMEIVSKENDFNLFCSSVVQQLDRYDEENGTLLKQSLEAYVESSRSIKRAADKLHVHKNTLYYRLKRAEELFKLDLNDENLCFHLQFSFRMQRMIE